MTRFSLEEAPPKRDRPKPFKKGEPNPNWNSEESREEVYRQQQEYAYQQAIKNEKVAEELNRRKDVVMSQLENAANSTVFTSDEIKDAVEEQRQKALDKLHDYKLGVRSLVTAGELGLSGASLLGAYANWKNWANAASATKRTIANLLQKAQTPMQLGGVGIDAYQTLDSYGNNAFDTYYNGASSVLGSAGTIGAMDIFRGKYPKVDRVLDVMGIVQNAGDFLKFAYDKTIGGD